MDLNEIKENYKNYDDSNIELIASEAYALHDEVIEVLKNEIIKRNLPNNLLDIVNAQTKEGILKNAELIRNQTCPTCNSKTKRLNATVIAKVHSFIISTFHEKEIKIACTDCLDEYHRKASKNTAIFGWWGIPKGPISTTNALIFNKKMQKTYRSNSPSETLKKFVAENATTIESIKNISSALAEFLLYVNDNGIENAKILIEEYCQDKNNE